MDSPEKSPEPSQDFFALVPDAILESVEHALATPARHYRASGRTIALNSIENRVYEIEIEGRNSVVAKFYRPGRWTREQLLEEHAALRELHGHEVPVVAPIQLTNGSTLDRTESGIFFTIFEKVRGRSFDELDDDKLKILGRFVGRLHRILGAMPRHSERQELSVGRYGWDSLDELSDSGFLNSPIGDRYADFARELLENIQPMFDNVYVQRVHGDCHLGNLLWAEGNPLFVDFDDLVWAPPVQDIWMIAGGRDEDGRRRRETLISAYEEMHSFDPSTLTLIEPLRILRLLHYSAWIARRWDDPSFPKMFPLFGTEKWWQEEIEALSRVRQLLFENN